MRDQATANPGRARAGTVSYDFELPDLTYLVVTPTEELTSLAKISK